jgi:hypothetical protein
MTNCKKTFLKEKSWGYGTELKENDVKLTPD